MNKSITTQEKLLTEARRLLWANGYSNVPVRQIAKAAEVDVALINRYFGSKMGLFDATLEGAFDNPAAHVTTPEDLTDLMVQLFITAPRDTADPHILRMILTNAHDEAVGEKVRAMTHAHFFDPFNGIIGDPARTALFMSVLMGISVVEKTLKLPHYPAPHAPAYEAHLRHMLGAALSYKGPET